MNCYVCAQQGNKLSAVSICKHCGAGLCQQHLAEARTYLVGGTTAYACPHSLSPNTVRSTG